jgi:hypothetical protein
MPDLSILEWIAVAYGACAAGWIAVFAFATRPRPVRPLVTSAEWARIEAYANDPRHAARGAVREAVARRNARTQTLVQGTQRNAPQPLPMAEARNHEGADPSWPQTA